MSAKSNRPARRRKLVPPAKPYPDFPLSIHGSGKFQKKVKLHDGSTKIQYFGAWAKREDGQLVLVPGGGWKDALAKYETWKAEEDLRRREAEALKAIDDDKQARAEEERVAALEAEADGRLTVLDMCDAVLDFKHEQMERKELKRVTYNEYFHAAELMCDQFGDDYPVEELGPNDFAKLRSRMSKKWGSPARVSKFITMTGTIFKTAFKAGWIDNIPNYGHDFSKPTHKRVKEHRDEGGDKLFARDEVHALLNATLNGAWSENKKGKRVGTGPSKQMRCMIFLGLNCGFGNKDVGTLPLKAIDLKNRIIKFPRPKTGVDRECPLWPETVRAIEDVLAERAKKKIKADTLFVTKYGNPFYREFAESENAKSPVDDAVKRIFKKLLQALHINGRRNLGFYSLRHTHCSVGIRTGDRDAVRELMGHSDHSQTGNYNHGQVPLKRRQAVVAHVRKWLSIAQKTPKKPR